MCDIEAMFHQVRVDESHRDLLRFLWWGGGDVTREPEKYRTAVHLFGATSSPMTMKVNLVLLPQIVFEMTSTLMTVSSLFPQSMKL